MKKSILFCILAIALFTLQIVFANPVNIRLALFDDPQPDPTSNENTQEFVNAYLAGVNTAIAVAGSRGVYISEKEFFHTSNLKNIIEQASKTKAWNPDVIIGFSTSNDFIMSKAFFGDQIILSISATDSALSAMPKGFYSLGIPDTDAVYAMINFINQHYPNSNLFITASAESKESVDFADLIAKTYEKKFGENRAIVRKFLKDDIDHLALQQLMAGYKENSVIVVMSIGYDSAIDLMNKISTYLGTVKPVFITSADNWGGDIMPKKITGICDAFRMDTLSGAENEKAYKIFTKNYEKIYHTKPKNKISFVTYQSVMSVVEALKKYPIDKQEASVKTALLNSYLRALKLNPNWYRPSSYMVYRLENQEEKYFSTIK